MRLTTVFPHLTGLTLVALNATPERLVLTLAVRRRSASCPLCHTRSSRVHSQYQRTLADLPSGGRPVVLRLQVRRFRCGRRRCARTIFAERVPSLAASRARRTLLQQATLTELGFALGGAAGARVAQRLHVPTGRGTLLRLVRAASIPEVPAPGVVGIDDWAWRRGHHYGTIVVDLERRRPIELLPERTAKTVADWLRGQAGIQIVSRDRAGAYAEGARQGAPQAIQVADRFHLLANVGEALERVLGRHHATLRATAAAVDARASAVSASLGAGAAPGHQIACAPRATRVHQVQEMRRARRLARYEAVLALHQQGLSQLAIAEQLGISPKTIRRFLRAGAFPERARPNARPSMLTPYESALRLRWSAGCHNAQTLWQEIRQQGFTGGVSIVRRFVAHWRTTPARRGRPARSVTVSATTPVQSPTPVRSPRQARWLLLRPLDELHADDLAYRAELLEQAAEIQTAYQLAEAFGRIVRGRDHAAFEDWLRDAETSAVAEFRGVAAGIRRDRAAVEAALALEWSNGQVEGQINRLKCLKRQMYGRAKLDLLRQRFLRAA